MSYDELFLIFNYGVMPFWALLIVLPIWRGTAILVHSGLVPVVLGVAYVILLVNGLFFSGVEGGGFGSLDGIMTAFTIESAMLAGWIHYLVFDLFVGSWEVRDARRHGIPHAVMIPVLLITLMAGPAGLLLYVLLRGFWKKRWLLAEA